jgi:hypothetical protein
MPVKLTLTMPKDAAGRILKNMADFKAKMLAAGFDVMEAEVHGVELDHQLAQEATERFLASVRPYLKDMIREHFDRKD